MSFGGALSLAQPCYFHPPQKPSKTLRTLNVFVPTSYKGDYNQTKRALTY